MSVYGLTWIINRFREEPIPYNDQFIMSLSGLRFGSLFYQALNAYKFKRRNCIFINQTGAKTLAPANSSNALNMYRCHFIYLICSRFILFQHLNTFSETSFFYEILLAGASIGPLVDWLKIKKAEPGELALSQRSVSRSTLNRSTERDLDQRDEQIVIMNDRRG